MVNCEETAKLYGFCVRESVNFHSAVDADLMICNTNELLYLNTVQKEAKGIQQILYSWGVDSFII